MELPLGGPALRHYTQSRPRPHRQKLNYRPSRPQETIIESENEGLEFMGRVDEGVEEFFTKRVLPTDALKKQDEESITVHEVAPASSVPCPPPTKTLRRKLGDFFTLKKRRALKSEASQEGRPKKASIADFIRPLRDKEKDKDRVKEQDKENEREKGKEHPTGVTGETAVLQTPASGVPPVRDEAVPPRRALREGKSQSLILLSGSAAPGSTNARNTAKKQFEGQHSFEQKLHLMLQRIGVSKAQPGETQNQEGEMKKAESEGTIIDSKPEPPPTFTKPRTMSASSDTRHQIRPSVSAHESAGKPALLPKPVLKPGPPPTTSGRNTPENELVEIEERETGTTIKPIVTAAPATPAAPAPPSVLTISVPDSKTPSSTVPPSQSDICTDSVKSTVAAAAPTNDTELNIKPSTPEANAPATQLPSTSIPVTPTSTTAPTDLPTTFTVSPSESITPSLYVTSGSATITMPSISTSETVPAVSTNSINLSTKLSFPESSDILPVDASPAAVGDAVSVIPVASSPSTSTSHMSTTTSSVTEASFESAAVDSASSGTLKTAATKTTFLPSDTISAISPDTLTTSSPGSPALLLHSSTASPTSTDCTDPITAAAITHPVTSPSTSLSETNPPDTTNATTSLTHADSTSTTTSAITAPGKSPLPADSDPPSTNNVNTEITAAISGLPTTGNTTISHHVTSQDQDSKSSEQRASVGSAETGTADEDLEKVLHGKQNDVRKKVTESRKGSENENDKTAVGDSKVTRKEVKEESRKLEEEAGRTEVAEPESGKDKMKDEQEGEQGINSAHEM